MALAPTSGVETVNLPGGELVARHPETGQALVLNAMGTIVWELCDGTLQAEEIASLIHERFPQEPLEQVAKDVEVLVQRLREVGLVEDRPGPERAGG